MSLRRGFLILVGLLFVSQAYAVPHKPTTKPAVRAAKPSPSQGKTRTSPSKMVFFPEPSQGMVADLNLSKILGFFAKEVPALQKEHHLVGSTLSVVYQGKVVLLRGDGFADQAKKQDVDPKKTLFRVGSISKLFAWTAVMQLVEAGKIDLSADIRKYVPKLAIPSTFSTPITMAHLMAHTPGFEDILLGLFTKNPKELKSLEQAILSKIPMRVRPSGKWIAYSNYGTALAGYIVSQISGMPFERYVEEKIFRPLQMKAASFSQLDTAKSADMSKGYAYQGKDPKSKKPMWKEQGFEFISLSPAGAMAASAEAMAHFMLAHLQYGSFGGQRILSEATAKNMQQTHFRMRPRARGFAHGFIEVNQASPRVIGHLGDTIYFHSVCVIFPQQQLGFFFSTNTSTGMKASFSLLQKFLARFTREVKGKTLAAKRSVPSASYLSQFTGSFTTNRRAESDMTKLVGLGTRTEVKLGEKPGQLEIFDFFKWKMVPHVEVEPDVFQEVDGSGRWVFLRDKKKKVYGVFGNLLPVMIFVRPPWYESLPLQIAILICFVFFLLLGLFARPIGFFTWFFTKSRPEGEERIAGLLGVGVLLGYLGFFVAGFFSASEDFIFEMPSRWPFLMLYLPILLSLGMVYFSVRSWTKGSWGILGRLFYTFFVVSMLAFAWFLSYWRVLA